MSGSLWQWAMVNFSYGTASFALNWLVQSSVLILAGLAISRLLARQGSAVQFVVYCTTLSAVMICPLLTWIISLNGLTQWSLAVPLPSVSAPVSVSAGPLPAMPVAAGPRAGNAPVPRVRLPREPQPAEDVNAVEPAIADAEDSEVAASSSAVEFGSMSPVESEASVTDESLPSGSAVSGSFPWVTLATVGGCMIWLTLSIVLLMRLAVAWFRLAGIRHRAIPAESTTIQICRDLSQQMDVAPPQVLHTPFLPSPCLAGLWKPTVLLPETELTLSVRDVLLHELAHLRRRDGHWNLLRKLATGLFWFQPLLWVLSRQIETAAEEVCDDIVVEFGGDREEYANGLVDVAEFSAIPMATAGVAMVSFRSMLAQRVARIMDTSRRLSTRTSRRSVTLALLAGSVGTLIIGLLGATSTTSAGNPAEGARDVVTSIADKIDSPGPATASFDPVPVPANSTPPTEATSLPPEQSSTAPTHRGSIPGLISTPSSLPGDRRWQMFTKHPDSSADKVSWSPDGRWLAIANGLIVRLFDFQNEVPDFKIVLAGHGDTVKSVRFDPQGTRLATASLDGTVRLWDLDGRVQFVYREHEDAVQDVSWHPHGDRLASASLDGTIRLWSIDGTTAAVLRDHDAPVNAVAWNPNGKWLASGCENKIIRYWNAEGVPGTLAEGHLGPVRSLAWNFDGSQLLSCDFGIEASDGQSEDMAHLRIWDLAGKPVTSLLINQPLSSVAWSPDGTRVVAGSWRSIKLWKIGERQASSQFSTSLNGFIPVAWRPTGDLIAGGPMLFDGNGSPLPLLPLRNAPFYSAGLNRAGTVLGVGRPSRSFDLFSSDGEQLAHFPPQPSNAYSLTHAIAWNPEGTAFIPGIRYHRELQRYDAKGTAIGTPIALPGDTRSLVWSRDGRFVAAGGDQQIVSLVDLETSKVVSIGKQSHGITQVRFTPDQQQVCSAGFDGCIRFWSLDGRPLKVLETISAPICSLAWASDGELLASGHQDNTIRLWSGSGELISVVGGHGGHVESLEFSPEGTLLASGSRDHSVRLWRRDGTPVSVLQGHSGTIYGIQWTADGRGIYSCATDGSIRRWDAETKVAEWQTLLGEAGGYVTLDAQGRIKHGDARILESDFVFFAEDAEQRLARIGWEDIRTVMPPIGNTVGSAR